MNSIFARRSIREFLDKPVESEKIDQILRAGMQAPTARNQRAWEFIVVTSQEDKEKVSQMSPFSKLAAKAAVLIILVGNKDKMTVPEKWQQDMGACTQNMLLQIVKEDLGGVWLGVYPTQERVDALKDIFNLPDNIIPFGVVCFGYSDKKNTFKDRYDESAVHWDKF
ncbi:nitroreductase family protein [Sebaldella sp. S0638]|uniref:nitroreductase family protein n=1 Tax=Sebaldella sp. S0638 TaxID=2957809 RepID=UPI00209EF889|nr:nitroreductase family protein [Sebaldella sp. S0638]MCP1223717.1 nitroreductase family protein [Sebaldella sp. S0638]